MRFHDVGAQELTDGNYCTVALGDLPEDQWAQVSPDANKRLRDTFLAVPWQILPSACQLPPWGSSEVVSYILPVVGPALAQLAWKHQQHLA